MIWEPHKDGMNFIGGDWNSKGTLTAHWQCGACPGVSIETVNTAPRYPHCHVEKIHEHVNSVEHQENKELQRLAQ